MRVHCFTDGYRFLVEATIDQTKHRVPIWTKQYFKNDSDKALASLPDIIAADPTNGKYSEWLIKQWRDGTANFPEDIGKLSKSLGLFHAKKTRLQEKDINKYSPGSLAKALDQELGLTQKEIRAARHGKLVLPPGAKVVLESGPYQVVKVSSAEASTKLCSGTEWCVANKDTAEYYLESGPLYLVYKDGEREVLVHFETLQFKDVFDVEVPAVYKFKLVDLLAPLSGFSKENSPELAYSYARDIVKGRWSEGEEVIANSSKIAVKYAAEVLKRRWPEIEEDVSKDTELAVKYAAEVLKRRWPEIEEDISKDANLAVKYAAEVLKRRWPEAEEVIAKSAGPACSYAAHVVQGRWPEGEESIIKSANWATYYAIYVLKDRWPEAEGVIAKSEYNADNYRDFLRRSYEATLY